MVHIISTRRTYCLDIGADDVYQEWFWDGKRWRKLTQGMRDSEWYCEEYCGPVTTSVNIITNLTEQLAGVIEWDDYGDFHITVDLDDLEISEEEFIRILKEIARRIKRRSTLEAYGSPYMDETIDAWGSKVTYWRCPAILPVPGTPELEYPKGLETA
jgi:hypothetical protein